MDRVKLFSVSSLLLLFTCATYIPIKVMRPAELDIPPFKKIAVMDFDLTGSWHFWFDDTKLTFADIAKKVIMRKMGLDQNTRPDPKNAYPGTEVTTKVIAGLVQNGHYQVLERSAIEKIMAEHKLVMSGLVDESQAAQIRKMLGVEAIILGSGTYSISDGGEWVQREEKIKKQVPGDSGKTVTVEETVTHRYFDAYRLCSMETSYRMIDITTGQIVASQGIKNSRRITSEKESEEDAYQTLPDWQPAIASLADGVASTIVPQLAPYTVYESRKIESGKSPMMKNALQYAKRGMIEDARGMWEQTSQIQSPKAAKDRIAAMHNLAVYAEVSGDLDKAENLFNDCYRQSGKTQYLDERARIQARKKEVERLKEQTGE